MKLGRFPLGALVLTLSLMFIVVSGCNADPNATTTPAPTGAPATDPIADPPTATPASSPVDTPIPSPLETPVASPIESASPGDVTYAPVTIPEIGLSLEAPADWNVLTPAWIWVAPDDDALRVGVNWVALEPPQEPEAALLPENAQVLDSTTVDLAIGTGRRFLVEVYGPATEGSDAQAPVASVQAHVLVTVNQASGRVAIDLYASAPTQDALATLDPVLQHMLDTAALQQAAGSGGGDPTAAIIGGVAAELGLPAAQIQLAGLQPVDWPDACLGLPAGGEVCAQVITPGYLATVTVEGLTYQVRVDELGQRVAMIPQAVSAAMAKLAKDLGIETDAIQIISFEAVEWPDACLGVRKAGQLCAQVITPGYRVILQANGQRYELHTDRLGLVVVPMSTP